MTPDYAIKALRVFPARILLHEVSNVASTDGDSSCRAGTGDRPIAVHRTAFGAITGAFNVSGEWGTGNFTKAFELYSSDIIFTFVIVTLSSLLIALFSIAIGGYLTLGSNPRAVTVLRWLYRWPLFIPFIVVGQILRTFLAKNGLMNSLLIETGILTPCRQ